MVDGEMQGRGIGSGIVADVRAAMKAAGYDYLSLVCAEENEEALEFWKAQGFTETDVRSDQNGYNVIVMERSI
jgi:ribosomal protein S18 acetylase RimI-like enzyme